MNAAREAKLRKLNELRRSVPYISTIAFAAVLEACYTEGVPDLHTRQDIIAAVKLEIGEATDYGHLRVQSELHMKDNSTIRNQTHIRNQTTIRNHTTPRNQTTIRNQSAIRNQALNNKGF